MESQLKMSIPAEYLVCIFDGYEGAWETIDADDMDDAIEQAKSLAECYEINDEITSTTRVDLDLSVYLLADGDGPGYVGGGVIALQPGQFRDGSDGDFFDHNGSCYTPPSEHYSEESITVTFQPAEPKCTSPQGHDWRSTSTLDHQRFDAHAGIMGSGEDYRCAHCGAEKEEWGTVRSEGVAYDDRR